MTEPIIIDGSFGEGGGQVLRSSLTLAACLGVPVRIKDIRARRPRPGLMNQHLAAARAAAKVCGGELAGASKGSLELTFTPGEIRAGHYSREIGTAGSATLIFQTLLPVLARAGRESVVTLYGGTHNPMAPPFHYLAECYLPALRLLGLEAEVELLLYGFYPKGGGAMRGTINPVRDQPVPLDLTAEVEWGEPEAEVVIANLPDHVADREQAELSEKLRIDPTAIKVTPLPGEVGPGNAVFVRYRAGDRVTLITAFGEPGKRAERVAQEAAREAKNFARSRAAVDPRLADQLILPLALGPGGKFSTSAVTEHARTQAEVIRRFLSREVSFEMVRPDCWVVSVPGGGR